MGGTVGGVALLSAIAAGVWYITRQKRPVEHYDIRPVEQYDNRPIGGTPVTPEKNQDGYAQEYHEPLGSPGLRYGE